MTRPLRKSPIKSPTNASADSNKWTNNQRMWTLLIVMATCINVGIQVLGGNNQSFCSINQALLPDQPVQDEPRNLNLRSTGGGTGFSVALADRIDLSPKADPCQVEYERVTANQTKGLTQELFQRANSYRGNRFRLARLGETLHNFKAKPRPIKMVVSGGSISLGHGVIAELCYSTQLQDWLNQYYPLPDKSQKHIVFNKGAHGADICAMAKRLNILMKDLPNDIDLFVLEFAVNDYQGQDHERVIDFRMDVFFDGFQDIALCTETVLHKLLLNYPQATILFLEMRTAIIPRKTAAVLHYGAAQHYQVPIISYDQALFPDYQYLLQLLKPFNYSTAPGDTVLPYPHGCHPCVPEYIVSYFRPKGCADLCTIQKFTGEPVDCTVRQGRVPCHVPIFAHDEVHPSGAGHKLVTDLITETIASATRDVCHQKPGMDLMAVIPSTGWMVSNPDLLDAQSAFLWVNDTYEIFVEKRPLTPALHTPGFSFYEDTYGRHGWIATNEAGGESISFDIQLPQGECYVPYLAYLKSYEKMGTFKVTVLDRITRKETTVEADGLWGPRISVPNDLQLLTDQEKGCTGNCQVTVTSNPMVAGRTGNKVKLVTLSVRRCV